MFMVHIMRLFCIIISRYKSAEDNMQYHNVRTMDIFVRPFTQNAHDTSLYNVWEM